MTSDATLTVGAPAPDPELTTTDSVPVRLSSLWQGRPLVLVFLAPLAGRYCIDNVIQLRDAYENVLNAGADLVAVGSGSAPRAGAFRKQWQLPFCLLSDPNEEAYEAFGVTTEQPGSFVIDSEGVIQFAHHNQSDLDTHRRGRWWTPSPRSQARPSRSLRRRRSIQRLRMARRWLRLSQANLRRSTTTAQSAGTSTTKCSTSQRRAACSRGCSTSRTGASPPSSAGAASTRSSTRRRAASCAT